MLNPFLTSRNFNALAAKSKASKPYIVVLDPGHGGNDEGSSWGKGRGKLREKDISLSLAIRTAKLLRDPDYGGAILDRPLKVVLTRERDQYVSLEKRAEKAKKLHADLFVSIHSNSDPTGKAEGLETYFLNNTDQTSDSKLEQIENKTTQRYKGPKKAASLLLRSISADAEVEHSREAASTIQQSLTDHLKDAGMKFHDRGVRQALLYVLLDSQVPAVLLEGFFLNNAEDRAFLTDPEAKDKIAEGLAQGILRYLALH